MYVDIFSKSVWPFEDGNSKAEFSDNVTESESEQSGECQADLLYKDGIKPEGMNHLLLSFKI